MEINEYVTKAMRTDSNYKNTEVHLCNKETVRLLHSAMGLCTESAEIQDQLKKHFFYNKELDLVNIKEEISDCLWYIALACDTLKVDPRDILDMNIKKLQTRYPEKFSSDKALNRDLEAERKILE